MTEQERAYLDEGTNSYLEMVEQIVRENFTALDTTDSEEEGGEGSQRDAAEYDLKSLDLDELERACGQVGTVLEGAWYIAEAMNPVLMMVVNDTRERTRLALERVKEFRAV